MLAPGEYLIQPVPTAPPATPRTERTVESTPSAPVTEAEKEEPRSFLMTLLRALGAIHS